MNAWTDDTKTSMPPAPNGSKGIKAEILRNKTIKLIHTWQISFEASEHADDPFSTGFSKYADMTLRQ